MEEKQLAGKSAVVTGAGRGIGRAIALRFARAGADIAIFARSADELDAVKAEAEALGVRCFVGVADLTDPAATEQVCNGAMAALRHIHILVNNAGGALERRKVAESDPERWWRTIEVNVRGPYLVTRFLLEGLAEGGKIINISSGMGLRASDLNSSYHVSKAGLHLFTEALASELWPRQIEVNNLIPGPVATDIFNRDDPTRRNTAEEILERYSKELPSGFPPQERMKHPDDVADLALYLAAMPIGGPTGQSFSLARRPL